MWWHPHHRCSRQVKRPHSTVAHFTLSNASSTTASYFTPWQLVLQLNCTAFRMVSANLAKSLFSATIRNHTEFEAVILNNHVSIHLPLSAWTLVTSSSYCYSSLVISLLWKQEIESGKFNAEIANRIFWIFQCFHNVGSGFMPEYLIISNSMTIPVWISFQWNKKAGKTIAKSWQITLRLWGYDQNLSRRARIQSWYGWSYTTHTRMVGYSLKQLMKLSILPN